jgi:hypothetical protein
MSIYTFAGGACAAGSRIAAVRSSTPAAAIFLMLGAMVGSATAIEVAVGPQEIIYSASQRKSKKLGTWPDGSMGAVSNGDGTYDFYGPNGQQPAMTTGPLWNPGASKQNVSITGLPKKTFNYVSGGPIYQDPESGARLMLYHAEKHLKGKAKNFYSMLGLAVSTDPDGRIFRDLGTIVEPNAAPGQTGVSADVGGGSFAVFDSHLHVYFRDYLAAGGTSELAVARAPLAELVTNALNGQGTSFSKYYDGGWSQPGLGGLSSPLEIGNPSNAWSAVSYNDYLDQVVLVTSQWQSANDGGSDLYLSTSHDGVSWSPRQALVTEWGEQMYPSLIGTGHDPTRTDQSFYVYYTDSNKGGWNRWKDAQLVRREIILDPEAPPIDPPTPDPPPAPPGPLDWVAVSGFSEDFQSGNPASGWSYAWNPSGDLENAAGFAPLVWSDAANAYNTTGGATPVPVGKSSHDDDYLALHANGGHPGRPGYLPIAGYTIQAEDGDGIYRIADSSIAKGDSVKSWKEDGLDVLVYINDLMVGEPQWVSTDGSLAGFDRELGELSVGDTIYVMVSPLNNQWYDAFKNFDFTIQKAVSMVESATHQLMRLQSISVPEPGSAAMLLIATLCCGLLRPRRTR